jgi:hypothetical protein
MRFLLLLNYEPGTGPQEGTPEYDDEMRRWGEVNDEMRSAGVIVAVSGVEPDNYTTVRRRGDDMVVSDGPFAETKEVMFSFYIVDVADRDAAIAWTRKMPSAHYGSISIVPTTGLELG